MWSDRYLWDQVNIYQNLHMTIETSKYMSLILTHIFYHIFIFTIKKESKFEQLTPFPTSALTHSKLEILWSIITKAAADPALKEWQKKYNSKPFINNLTDMHTYLHRRTLHAGTHITTQRLQVHNKKEWNKCVSLHTLPAECFTKIAKYYCSFQ